MRKTLRSFVFYGLLLVLVFSIALFLNTNSSKSSPSGEATASPAYDLGKSIYTDHCAACHGADGKGNGIDSPDLIIKPRDFTSGVYKFRSTKSGSIPTDDNLAQSINRGLHGTAMPGWSEFISGDSLHALISYVKSFSPRFQNEQPNPVTVSSPIPPSDKSIEAGKAAFEKLQCTSCHGSDGAGTGAVATDLTDNWGNNITITNLTQPWTFRGGSSAGDIYLRLKTGVDGTPMPSFEGSATDADLWNVANYVYSLGRKPVWQMNADELAKLYAKQDAENSSDPVKRGKYLVTGALACADCHTPYAEGRKMMEQYRMAGGARWSFGPYGEAVSANLTSDKETGLGTWTDDQIKTVLTKGIRHDGSRMLPFPMPWTAYSNLSTDDLNAVIAYLRTLPPVYNKIPPLKPLGFFSYMAAKFKMLILHEDLQLSIYPGNAGQTKETGSMETSHQQTFAGISNTGKEK